MRGLQCVDVSGSGEEAGQTATPRVTAPFVGVALLSLLGLLAVVLAYGAGQPVYPRGSLAEDARGGSAGACRMSFVSPSYLRVEGFGREYSRLAGGPWALYLYREAGWDAHPLGPDGTLALPLAGTPLVFVPGNAGSFRQARSLASAASRAWWERPGERRKAHHPQHGGRPLDLFTIDYNDDFSAFHGQTLLDQAEYLADSIRFILTLYHKHPAAAEPDPTSVVVVAHSMGGVVARAAFLHPHFQRGSISTLVTVATPHVVPPVTVDRNVDRVYAQVNDFWRRGYGLASASASASATEREALADLVLVSIGGGLSDITIASESVSLASLLPLDGSHGFTVFTTAIPGLRSPVDHLAVLWCQQLMQTLAQSILAIVDVRSPLGVVPREQRVARLRERLLDGLDGGPGPLELRPVELAALERGGGVHTLAVGERLVVREAATTDRATFLLPIPPVRTYGSARVFSLLTSSSIGRAKDSRFEVYACAPRDSTEDPKEVCTPLFPSHVSALPLSRHSPTSPILPAPTELGTMGYVTIDVSQLAHKTSIAVVVKPGSSWAIAEFGDRKKRVHVVDKSALQLLMGGFKLESFPASASLVSEVWIPALDTSLLTLKMHVYRSGCQDSTALFAPLVRQYSPLVHETKYFPNARVASLYTHSSGPFQSSAASPFASSGTRLQFFLDPTCAHEGAASDIAVEITVDVWATLGSLVTRYRMAAVAFPFAIIMLVVSRQMNEYNAGSAFPPFGTAMSLFARDSLLPLLGTVTGVALLQSIALGTHQSSSSEAHLSTEPGQAYYSSPPARWISDALLGNRSTFFLGLAAFLLFACVGAVALEYVVLQSLVTSAAALVRLVHSSGPSVLRKRMQISEPHETLPLQRVLSMGALLLLVLFFAPYQFAFLVIFLIHFFSTVRALLLAQDVSSPATPASTKRLWDRYHYSFATLLVMLALLPITALILVVWVRNLAVGWLAPFSSDHNVVNVFGFLLHVEALHSGKMIQRSKGRLAPLVSTGLAAFCAGYGVLYGIRYSHNIYPLTNAWFLWLAANNSQVFVGVLVENVIGKRRSSQLAPRRADLLVGAPTPSGPATTASGPKRTLD